MKYYVLKHWPNLNQFEIHVFLSEDDRQGFLAWMERNSGSTSAVCTSMSEIEPGSLEGAKTIEHKLDSYSKYKPVKTQEFTCIKCGHNGFTVEVLRQPAGFISDTYLCCENCNAVNHLQGELEPHQLTADKPDCE